jgi:release factor glutamine methyltransferase
MISGMTLGILKSTFYTALKDLYPKPEIVAFFYRLCDYKLGLKRVDIALSLNKKVAVSDILFFKKALNRLKRFEPIQYITGRTEFYNLTFNVDKNVLIPRPETEELVSWILETGRAQSQNILDIGTGSGCIAIALAKNMPQASVWALDISKKALELANKNADLNQVNINFIQADILQKHEVFLQNYQSQNGYTATEDRTNSRNKTLPLFDIIVSNPPYVKHDEKILMKPNVLNHEPHLALFVEDNNPLLFYDKIADFASKFLTKNGTLYFEINQSLSKDVCSLLKDKGFRNVSLRQDLFEADRMVKANKF